MSRVVRKAVIPAAGLGTRFLPATKAIPKEMIPIVDVPMIQHIVDEARRSGIEHIVLVTARHKEAIENHFDNNYELEHTLDSRGKEELASVSRRVGEGCEIISVRQKNPMGLGHAILCAEPVIGDEPFAVLLGDDLIDGPIPCTKQLIQIYQEHNKSVVGVMKVPKTDVSKYGIVGGEQVEKGLTEVSKLVEKPAPNDAPSTLAIPGRYVLSPEIFSCLKKTPPGRGNEIQLTDALQILTNEKGLLAAEFNGTRYDTGDRIGFIDATLAFALKRQDLAGDVRELMRKHLSDK